MKRDVRVLYDASVRDVHPRSYRPRHQNLVRSRWPTEGKLPEPDRSGKLPWLLQSATTQAQYFRPERIIPGLFQDRLLVCANPYDRSLRKRYVSVSKDNWCSVREIVSVDEARKR